MNQRLGFQKLWIPSLCLPVTACYPL